MDWRPKVRTSIKRPERSEGTTPKTTPTSQKEKGPELRQKMIRIMKATPTISKAELTDLLPLGDTGIISVSLVQASPERENGKTDELG